MDHDVQDMLGGVFDSFSTLSQKDNITLCPEDASRINIRNLVDDHIYGLLSEEELSPTQVNLLRALLSYRGDS
jgi:hypothetical protein